MEFAEFADVVRGRRMVRTYDPDRPVPREQLEMLLKLAIRAPSAGHTQGWRFLVLDDITSRDCFWTATSDGQEPIGTGDSWRERWARGMRTAPVLVVCFSDEQAYRDRYAEPDKTTSGRSGTDDQSWPIPYWHVDVGMAAMILMLGAQAAGLGACFFGVPASAWDPLRTAFDVPTRLSPVGVVSLGHPAPDRRSPSLRRGRRGLDEVVSYGRFGSSA